LNFSTILYGFYKSLDQEVKKLRIYFFFGPRKLASQPCPPAEGQAHRRRGRDGGSEQARGKINRAHMWSIRAWWLSRRRARRWPAARQWWHGRRGLDSGEMRARLSHCARVGAQVGAREELRVGRAGGAFIGQQRSKAISPSFRWPQWQRHGRGGGWWRAVASGQWRQAVRPPASVGSPRGTGLGHLRTSMALDAQCPRRPASNRGVFRRLGVHARLGYGGGRRRAGARALAQTVSCSRLQNDFSPKFETKVH
jgi:hypothetical protein